MKITFLLPHVKLSGGVKAILEYANRISGMGYEVRILLPAARLKWFQFGKKFQSRRAEMAMLPPETVDWFDNKLPIEVLADNNPKHIPAADVLIATAWQTAEWAAQLPPETGRKFYFIQHYESLWTRKKEQAENTYRLPFRKMVISSWLKTILSEKFQQDSRVFVTPVDGKAFFCHDKEWNRPRKVCLLHHDYDWKGYRDGIEAVRSARSRNRPIDLVVFGEKVKDPAPLFREAGFEFEYHYRPMKETLRKIYTSCDIYLCPSWHEGLGMPPMEAMACRCTLVTTDTGGCRDYAIDGVTALISPPKNPHRLAENLSAVLDDEHLLFKLSENGHGKIKEFSWDENCRQMVQWFEKSV